MSESEMGNRQTYWSEINSDEKIERLREEAKRLEEVVSEMRTQMYKFNGHLHNIDGGIVIRLNNDGIPMQRHYRTAAVDGDDVYF